MLGRGNRFYSSGCGQIWWMAQGLGGGYHQAGEAHGEGGGGDNNEEKMEQLLQRVVKCGARQCAFSWRI